MEHYKIEAISDILTRSDLGNTRADFADLVAQFETLKTARNEHAAQFELNLKKTRAEAFALFDSVPYLEYWIAERVQQLELWWNKDYIKENIDFHSIINNYFEENIDLEEMITERVDFDELVSNNLDFDELASNAAITAVDDYIQELSISIRID